MEKLNFIRSIIFFLTISQSLNLFAQTNIPDSLVHKRIIEIQNMLNRSKPGINGWWYGWLGGYSAATVGQGAAFILSHDKATQQDMALGASTTFLGAIGQLIMPINTNYEMLDQLSDTTSEDQLKKLHVAEELLRKTAMSEKAGRSFQIHALYGVVNLGSGLITWIAFKRSVWAGVGNFVFNSVISEVQIFTQPTRAMKDYQDYCRKYNSDRNPLANKYQPEYFVSAYPGGVALRIVF